MEGRKDVPRRGDSAELLGGGKVWSFWMSCKSWRRCARPPYDQLLSNPVLRADYRTSRVFFKEDKKIKNDFLSFLAPLKKPKNTK